MIASLELGGHIRQVNLAHGISLAIPMAPGGRHPKFFIDRNIHAEPLQSDGFTGQVADGGSCNVESIAMIPHCHGTHTEGPGHITREPVAVQECLDMAMLVAALVSVNPRNGSEEQTAGTGPVIAADQLEFPAEARALIIRTLPNDHDKCRRDYASAPPYPLLSVEAMDKLVEANIEHLLIDTPSVDTADDGGRLVRHRRFWGMGEQDAGPAASRAHCTITEMIFVPDAADDGLYLLNQGVGALQSDAAASAPVIYPVC